MWSSASSTVGARRLVARIAAASGVLTLIAVTPLVASSQGAPAATTRPDDRYVVEYYYKVRWGFQNEFIALFKKNHLPLLLGRVQKGTIVEVTAVAPRYHSSEEGRWDYRVTIVFPSLAAAHLGESVTEDDKRRLFPDSALYAREEHRRFEILEAHWDTPLVPVDLKP
ncbi:MAG: hypothetical protein U0164_13280 [Gemmatimonadaceae bacterium]